MEVRVDKKCSIMKLNGKHYCIFVFIVCMCIYMYYRQLLFRQKLQQMVIIILMITMITIIIFITPYEHYRFSLTYSLAISIGAHAFNFFHHLRQTPNLPNVSIASTVGVLGSCRGCGSSSNKQLSDIDSNAEAPGKQRIRKFFRAYFPEAVNLLCKKNRASGAPCACVAESLLGSCFLLCGLYLYLYTYRKSAIGSAFFLKYKII